MKKERNGKLKKAGSTIPGRGMSSQAQELRKNQRFMESLLENIPDMIFVKDAKDLRFVRFNKAGEELLGYSRDDLLGKCDYDFFPKEEADFFTARDRETLASGKMLDVTEEPIQTKHLGLRWLHTKKIPVLDEKGVPEFLMGISADITARKRLEDEKQQMNAELQEIVSKRTLELRKTNQALQKEIAERKKAEDLLRESENKYRTIFEKTGTAMVILEEDTTISLANTEFEKLTGYTRQEIESKKRWPEFVVKEDLEKMLRQHRLRRIDKDAAEKKYEFRFIDRQGNIKNVFLTIEMIPGTKKSVASFLDITERKRSEEALRESEEKYRSLFNTANDAIFLMRNDRFIDCNDATLKIYGCTKEQIIGNHPYVFSPALQPDGRDSKEKALEKINKAFSGEPQFFEWLHCRYDRSPFYAEVSLNRIDLGNDTILQAIVRDITARKQAEEALRQSEARYKLITDNMTDTVWLTDMNLKGTWISPSVERSRGYSLEELRALPFEKQVAPASLEAALKNYSEVMRPENLRQKDLKISRKVELEVTRKDGSTFWKEIWVTLLRDPQGNPIGLLGTGRDITERKQAEEALGESEKKYRLLVENSSDLIFSTDVKGYFTYVNPVAEHFAGWPSSAIVGKHYYTFLRPDFREELDALYRKQYSENIPNTYFEYPIITRNGETKWIGQNVQPLMGHGRIIGFQAMARDITARRQVEEALRESEARYKLITDNMSDTLWLMDMNLQTTWISPSVERNRGYTLEEIRTLPVEKHVTPESMIKILKALSKELTPERLQQKDLNLSKKMELEFCRKDGSTLWSEVRLTLLRDPEGKPIGLLGVGRDITQRRQAEEALRESEEKYSTVVKQAQDGVIIIQDSRLQFTNEALANILGYRRDEMDNMPFVDFVAPESRALVASRVESRLAGRDVPQIYEAKILHKDGRVLDAELSASVIQYRGKPADLGIIRDTTERKRIEEERRRLEERLQRAEKMEALGTLAGGVAHDLNNVLGVLVGYSELLLRGLEEGSPLRRHATHILQSGQRGAAIIQDLLTLARRGVSISEVVNLNEVVSDYLQTPEFEKLKVYHPGVKIEVDFGKDLLNIKGSPVHLGKTIMNLASNASEAITDRGEVTIRTENRYLDKPIRGYDDVKEGDYVVLTISDNGEGILASDIGKIFEPFYTKKVMGRSGTGLGLAVVWGTVKDHKGYIDVKSGRGQGSSFMLYFPITRETPVRDRQEVSPASYMGGGESILVVDDVEGQRELAVSMLTSLGYRVHAVSSGEEAVEYLKVHQADLLVLDMIMDPGIDGLATYRRVLKISPKQKAIIVSGFSETDRVRKAQKLGAGTYVQKPYILEKIGLAIRDELLKTNSHYP